MCIDPKVGLLDNVQLPMMKVVCTTFGFFVFHDRQVGRLVIATVSSESGSFFFLSTTGQVTRMPYV